MITHNITNHFHSAARQIVPGALIKDDQFSLFEAVGALEIGDPKMDSGCLEPGESMDQEFDMEKQLLPDQLIWLMDELFNREVAWLMGYPLSQTLFTSIHIDRLLWPDPKALEESTFIRGQKLQSLSFANQILRVYCLLLIKTCDLVLGMVTSQHFYEEEDFTTQLFNRDLLHKFHGADISAIALETLSSLSESTIQPELREAVSIRLAFRKDVLEMLMQHATGRSPADSLHAFMHGFLNTQQRTHYMGTHVAEAFSTKLQRRLASTVPPRPMVTVSMDQAWSFWHSMLEDCKNVFSVHLAEHSQDLFTAYEIFAYSSPQPSTYPRALLQSFLSHDNQVASRIAPRDFLLEDLQSCTMPASQLLSMLTDDHRRLSQDQLKALECLQTFIDKFEFNFVNIYRALCLNNCRIRRTFCHALQEWDASQSQVEELDTIIQQALQEEPTNYLPGSPPTFSFTLSSWVYHHKLNILQLTVQMGFGQTIYAPNELAGMYWYLSSICDIHLSHLERISHFITLTDTGVKQTRMNAAVKEEAVNECKAALDRLYRQYAWIKATNLLATTIHGIFVVLARCKVFIPQKPLYSADTLRYDIRMKPFLGLSIPEPLNHETYCAEVEMGQLATKDILRHINQTSAEAKKAWEILAKSDWNMRPTRNGGRVTRSVLDEKWTTGVKSCLKAAIGASLCVLTLTKGFNNEQWKMRAQREATIPDLGEKGRWHEWWIVPALPSL